MTDKDTGNSDTVLTDGEKSTQGMAWGRFARYLTLRSIAVLLTVAVGIYIAIWVSQLGGYADEWRRNMIRATVMVGFYKDPVYMSLSYFEKQEYTEDAIAAAIANAGLDRPFFLRSFQHFTEAVSLTLGEAKVLSARSGSKDVKEILLEALPMTLLLFGTANLLSFFGGLFVALFLSRRYRGLFDRAAIVLVPALAAPPWFHGIFLIVIFAVVLHVLPYGGIVDAPPPPTTFAYALSMLKHMILPVLATVLGTMPFTVYSGRAFFLIHSSDDYVEMAKAKGLSAGRVQRRYVLRPVLPPILTNFTFTLIGAWQGAILTELIFNWPGIGRIMYMAIYQFEVPVIIGCAVIFAYLLALSVLLLDILYAVVDPRVKLGAKREAA